MRNIEAIAPMIDTYLKNTSLHDADPSWELRNSALDGFGVFARRSIEVGEVIYRDSPIILGPKAGVQVEVFCVNCYKKESLELCEKLCGLKLCPACQNSSTHLTECKIIREWRSSPGDDTTAKELTRVLAPIRSLLLNDEDKNLVKCLKSHNFHQHGFEVDLMKDSLKFNIKEDDENFMRFVCAAMDANAFEVVAVNGTHQISLRGLYPLGSLANHSCTPNTTHVFDEHHHMVVKATRKIAKNAEIFHSYSRFTWGTPTRRYHLNRTKHFLCKCERCMDPTEFGSYMSAVLCKSCKIGNVIATNPLVNNEKWQCEVCGEVTSKKEIASLASLLGSALNSFQDEDTTFMLRFLNDKLCYLVPENHETVVELKMKLVWIWGNRTGCVWSELSHDLLSMKEKFCRDLLNLLEVLKLGQCQLRGLILYELCGCLEEQKRRDSTNLTGNWELERLRLEASEIFLYDARTPPELKKLWKI